MSRAPRSDRRQQPASANRLRQPAFNDLTRVRAGGGHTPAATDGSMTPTSGAFEVNSVSTIAVGVLELRDDIAGWGYVAGGTVSFDGSGRGVPRPGRPTEGPRSARLPFPPRCLVPYDDGPVRDLGSG